MGERKREVSMIGKEAMLLLMRDKGLGEEYLPRGSDRARKERVPLDGGMFD